MDNAKILRITMWCIASIVGLFLAILAGVTLVRRVKGKK